MSADEEVTRLNKALENTVNGFFETPFESCSKEEFERRLDVAMKSSLAMLAATQAAFIRMHGPEYMQRLFSLSMSNVVRLTMLHLNGQFDQPPPDAQEPEAPKTRLH